MKSIQLEGPDLAISNEQRAQEDNGLLDAANVVGVGVGRKQKNGVLTKEPCMTVLVSQKLDLDELSENDRIPPTFGKCKTDVVEVGHLFAGVTTEMLAKGSKSGSNGVSGRPRTTQRTPRAEQPPLLETPSVPLERSLEADTQLLSERVRPALGGYSVGHYKVTAGTIATGVLDLQSVPGAPQKYYLLSNNHVLADSNAARIGDPILQPGPADGGTAENDVIGHLSRFVPIHFGAGGQFPSNYVDAAIAEVPFHSLNREIFYIGYPGKQLAYPGPGEVLQKTGRTTNFTTGSVMVLNATVNVNYWGGRVARFLKQIVTTPLSAGGDSGSLVLNLQDQPVGLLFAGSAQATVLNPIAYVQRLLQVRIGF